MILCNILKIFGIKEKLIILLAIAINIPQRLKTGFMIQATFVSYITILNVIIGKWRLQHKMNCLIEDYVHKISNLLTI